MSKAIAINFVVFMGQAQTGECEQEAVNEQTNEQEEPFAKLHTAGPVAAKQKNK